MVDAGVVARKLALHTPLSSEAREALDHFLGRPREFAPNALIARAGEPADVLSVIGSGVACRMSLLPDGDRQIHSILLAGDAADIEASLLAKRSDFIQAITKCSVWTVPKGRLATLPRTPHGLAEALLREATIGAEITREWVVNLGRRSGTQRIAHLVCELCARMDAMGVGQGGVYPFPLTQQDIADAQGLSPVHVNRVLQDLKARGLIAQRSKTLKVLDRKGLEATGLFNALYLHFQNA
jgi:CRP-like cAMP-binding protein